MKLECSKCKAEVELPEDLKKQIAALILAKKQAEADAAALVKVYSGIQAMFDLKSDTGGSVLRKLPGILLKVQNNPAIFQGLVSADIQEIIDRYTEK